MLLSLFPAEVKYHFIRRKSTQCPDKFSAKRMLRKLNDFAINS
jgi:hypothetical protein